jgi:peroxiredoxin
MPAPKTDRILQFLLAGALAALGITLWDAMRDKVVNVGDIAPDFTITTETGQTVSRANFGGKVLILNFWASWCAPCAQETPSLESLHRLMKDSGVVVLAISNDKTEEKYKRFLKRYGVTFHTARDVEAKISDSYGTYRYPETYVINKEGKVAAKYIGFQKPWTDENVLKFLKSLL